jgi:hypothetical protein
MEVYPEWIPLGVWRFREICREALKKKPVTFNTLTEAIKKIEQRLQLPIERWIEKSKILSWTKTQTRLTRYLTS